MIRLVLRYNVKKLDVSYAESLELKQKRTSEQIVDLTKKI